MHNNRSRGFTLIELLVVIAIIGILSAVVLASLNTARTKGNDASIKSNLDSIRTQSAIYYDTNNGYGTNAAAAVATAAGCSTASTLFVDPSIVQMLSAAESANGTAFTNLCSIAINGATWAVYSPLFNPAAGTAGWCIDSTGQSKASTVLVGATCP